MAQVALSMIEAELAVPRDWRGDLERFLETTLRRWVGTLQADRISREWFGLGLVLSNAPSDPERPEDVDPPSERVFLSLFAQPEGHTGLLLERPLEILERADRRFPAMFYQRFTSALQPFIQVWDFGFAVECEEYGSWGEHRAEWAEVEEEEGNPRPSPSASIPASLKRKAVTDETVRRALKERGYPPTDTCVGFLMWGVLELGELSRAAHCGCARNESCPFALTDDERLALFDDYMEPPPSLILMMREGDAFAHVWDYEGQRWQWSGEPCMPTQIWAFDPTPRGVAAVYERLERLCQLLVKAGELIDRLNHPNELLWATGGLTGNEDIEIPVEVLAGAS